MLSIKNYCRIGQQKSIERRERTNFEEKYKTTIIASSLILYHCTGSKSGVLFIHPHVSKLFCLMRLGSFYHVAEMSNKKTELKMEVDKRYQCGGEI